MKLRKKYVQLLLNIAPAHGQVSPHVWTSADTDTEKDWLRIYTDRNLNHYHECINLSVPRDQWWHSDILLDYLANSKPTYINTKGKMTYKCDFIYTSRINSQRVDFSDITGSIMNIMKLLIRNGMTLLAKMKNPPRSVQRCPMCSPNVCFSINSVQLRTLALLSIAGGYHGTTVVYRIRYRCVGFHI